MLNPRRKIFIGVAWPYVNDLFHIGNLAGAYLPPDIFARFHKLSGNEVLMVSGSDFHGTPITIRASQERVKPEAIAMKFHKLNQEYLKKFRIEYTIYTSTHTNIHKKTVQDMFLRLMKGGYIKILKTKQLYSEKSQKFLQDRYIKGGCPYCYSEEARGDQCEACGRVLEPLELINPISKIDKSSLTIKPTENYFFDLEKLQKPIEKWLISRKEMREWVKKEALGWIKEGLTERAITRDMDYGVPLPTKYISRDQKIENIKNKVFYVWFEAVIGYLSAAIEYSQRIKLPDYWKEFFYSPDGETFYFVGQDNLVFHTINWPAQLIAYDKKINLPKNVFVNKFLLLEGRKMSKSRHWHINTQHLLENYPVDSIRFYLAFNMPEQKELDFRWNDFIETNNNILVATIGNFIHRVITFTVKSFGFNLRFTKSAFDKEVIKNIEGTFRDSSSCLEQGRFKEALKKIIDLVSFGNQYVDKYKIWEINAQNKEKIKAVIQNNIAIIDALRILLYPFMPDSAESLNTLLGYPRSTPLIKGVNNWKFKLPREEIKFPQKMGPLFRKFDKKRVAVESEILGRGNTI